MAACRAPGRLGLRRLRRLRLVLGRVGASVPRVQDQAGSTTAARLALLFVGAARCRDAAGSAARSTAGACGSPRRSLRRSASPARGPRARRARPDHAQRGPRDRGRRQRRRGRGDELRGRPRGTARATAGHHPRAWHLLGLRGGLEPADRPGCRRRLLLSVPVPGRRRALARGRRDRCCARSRRARPLEAEPRAGSAGRLFPLLLIGILGALAFASENAHQSWSAVFAQDELGSSATLTSVAPAVFAATVAITRFSIGGLSPPTRRRSSSRARATAGAGALVIATAPTLLVAALGLVLAGAAPRCCSRRCSGSSRATSRRRAAARATSAVTVVSYMGFLLGPVYVGVGGDDRPARRHVRSGGSGRRIGHADSDAAAPDRLLRT